MLGPDQEVDAEVAALGAARSGDLVVLMDFDGRVAVTTEIVAAFLLVDPEPSSPGPTAPIDVAVRPIVASWDLAAVSYGRTPSLGGELTRTRVPPARRAPLRLDVTRFVAKRHGAGLGFALSASGDDPVGARLLMLVESSVGPRLELYLK